MAKGEVPMKLGAVASLLLLAGAPNVFDQFDKPWERDWKGRPPTYSGTTSEGNFHVFADEVQYEAAGGVSFWLHGEHAMIAGSKYASSLRHIRLDCKGRYSTDAYTTFAANNKPLDDWDGSNVKPVLIRPGTMYAQIEKILCKPRPK